MKNLLLAVSVLTILTVSFIWFSACATVEKGVVDTLAAQGKISEQDKTAILKTTAALRSTFADITEEEEYYIGRSVSALILSKYKVYDRPDLTAYVNRVGQAVVSFSSRPETYAGYHFLILDSDEVNAMAAPGGFIFITKGLLKTCRDEEMLAAVLAHEVGHVAARHGLQSIKKARLMDAFKLLASEAASRAGSEEFKKLVGAFDGLLGDILSVLVERGYDRKFEYEADSLSVKFLAQTGYSPSGLSAFLEQLEQEMPATTAGARGWFRTHPLPADRLEKINREIASAAVSVPAASISVRQARFQKMIQLAN
ncbi:MAG: M48 family metalloprotease [Candidatus Saccharicenans sp.]